MLTMHANEPLAASLAFMFITSLTASISGSGHVSHSLTFHKASLKPDACKTMSSGEVGGVLDNVNLSDECLESFKGQQDLH